MRTARIIRRQRERALKARGIREQRQQDHWFRKGAEFVASLMIPKQKGEPRVVNEVVLEPSQSDGSDVELDPRTEDTCPAPDEPAPLPV